MNNEAQPHHLRVASQILAYVEIIVKYMFRDPAKGSGSPIQPRPRWNPHPPGTICINVDTALFSAERCMGWGAVLRDHSGTFMLAAQERLACFPPPELAEALAVCRALTVSREHGVHRVLLISDCLSLVQRILSQVTDRSALGAVIGDIKNIARDFESCSFSFSSRKNNVVAHTLARNRL
jgi:ribonuclease HI